MKKTLRKILSKIHGSGNRLTIKDSPASTIQDIQAIRVKPWFKDNGDKTHRLNYPLNESSFVMDLGGYKGEWSNEIFAKYQSSINIFEPHTLFYKRIVKRFKNNPKIKVYPFGLGEKTEKVGFSVADNASSIFDKSSQKDEIQLIGIKEFIEQNRIKNIDLIKINIEGGEYELLESILKDNLIFLFKNIQVQFHDFFPEAKERMNKIQKGLEKTHELTYQYEFVWENWRRKD